MPVRWLWAFTALGALVWLIILIDRESFANTYPERLFTIAVGSLHVFHGRDNGQRTTWHLCATHTVIQPIDCSKGSTLVVQGHPGSIIDAILFGKTKYYGAFYVAFGSR